MATVEDRPERAALVGTQPAKRKREDTRERILEVATDEFAQKGLAGARVDEIAGKAKANKQLVYYYFGGKLGLYNEVLGHMIEESRLRISAEASCKTLAEKFRMMVDRGIEVGGVRWQRLLGWEALEAGTTNEFVREADRAGTWQRHVTNVREAQAAGEIDEALDPELVALALVSVTVFPFVLPQVSKFLTGVPPSDPAFISRYEDFVEQLVGKLAPS
jgi:TetR/AcrR family transcriptional regulator